MNIAFFTEMNFTGMISRDHTNMRTEFAWMCALDQISELGPENKTPRRKFHGESDVQVKNSQFLRPEAEQQKN